MSTAVLTLYDESGRAVAEYELAPDDQPLAHRPLEINSTIDQDIIDGSSGLDSFTTRVSGMVREGATWTINAPRVIRRLPQSGVAIPRAHQLGRAAYLAWRSVMPGDGEPMMSWHSLPESERNAWRLVGATIADEVSAETLRRRAPIPGPRLPKPPPSPVPPCPAWRFEVHTRYNCHRSDPHPADYGTLAEGHYWVAVEP